MPHRLTILLVFILALSACVPSGGDPASDDDTQPPSAAGTGDEWVLVIVDGPVTGPGISVEDAFDHGATDDIVVVSGALFVAPDGTVRLCDAIAESFPPQCGGARIVVLGLDLASVPGLQTEGDVSWAEGVTLLGSVE